MPLYATKNTGSGDFEIAPAGLVNAVCSSVIDLGFHKNINFPNSTAKQKIAVSFEIDKEIQEGDFAGQRFTLTKEYSLSLAPKANLKKDLEPWIGTLTEDQLESFDVETLIGKPCFITIVHQAGKKDPTKIYANIGNISPVMEGTPTITPRENYIPKWVTDKIAQGTGDPDFQADEQPQQTGERPSPDFSKPPQTAGNIKSSDIYALFLKIAIDSPLDAKGRETVFLDCCSQLCGFTILHTNQLTPDFLITCHTFFSNPKSVESVQSTINLYLEKKDNK